MIDASVALKWFVEEDGSTEAVAFVDGPKWLIAPELILAEVLNVAWRLVRRSELTAQQHDQIAVQLPIIVDELIPLRTLASRSAVIARQLGHPVYDCFYLALAEDRNAQLLTADLRLLARVEGTPWAACALNLYSTP